MGCEGCFSGPMSKRPASMRILPPGLALAGVRYLDQPGQNIWHFPRLYIDGDSWVWKYAVEIVQRAALAGTKVED